jgi:sn-glycerol 3-phosphate transport system permease protein
MHKRVVFRSWWLPFALVAPQVAITLVFFIWPAYQALESSLFLEDVFGFNRTFVWFENFTRLFRDPVYIAAFWRTIFFGFAVTAISMGLALLLALAANRVLRSALAYRTLLIWPYAVAPAIAGVLWFFMMNPQLGIVAYWLEAAFGVDWNHYVNGRQALLMVIIAAAWQQISYNFLFFLAGLQSIPKSMIEAAAIDGASPARRFWTIVMPLLSPTTFFLLVVNLVNAFFNSFGIIHATTGGGPANATNILVYQVYATGFIGQDYGSSAAQSVILMALVIGMTVIQFRYIERRVNY